MLCTCASQVYDVLNFDMIVMLRTPYVPGCCEWVFKRGEAQVGAGSCMELLQAHTSGFYAAIRCGSDMHSKAQWHEA